MSDLKWHRCSPVSALYFLVKNIQASFNLWPALAGIMVVEDLRKLLFPFGVIVIFGLLIISAILSYWYFRFSFNDKRIILHSGFLHKKKLTLGFDRVQEINLEQVVYFRPFGLWTLGLESAGSAQKEIAIPGLHRTLAKEIKLLYAKQKKNIATNYEDSETRSDSGAIDESSSKKAILRIKFPELIRFGLMHNVFIYLAAIAGTLMGQSEAFRRTMFSWIESSTFVSFILDYVSHLSANIAMVVFAGIVAIAIVFIYAISIGLASIKFWDYTLYASADRYQFNAGLLKRVSKSFKLHKLQSIRVKQSIIARILRRHTLEIFQTNEYRGAQNVQSTGFIVPVLSGEKLQELLRDLKVEDGEWQYTQPIQILWGTLIYGAVLSILSIAPSWYFEWDIPAIIVFIFIAMGFVHYRYWRNTRFYLANGWVAVRRGFVGYSISYVPLIKLQKIALSSGPFLRLHNTARLHLWSGARVISIGFVPKTVLDPMRDTALDVVSNYKGRWM